MKTRSAIRLLLGILAILLGHPAVIRAAPLEWTNTDGKTIQAEFVGMEDENVVIRKDGKEFSIPMAKLSLASRNQARKLAADPSGAEMDFSASNKEIINLGYFQKLIASGVTTKDDLQNVAVIRPCENGFWGLSGDVLDWHEAQQLAVRSGARICRVDASSIWWSDMLKFLQSEFPQILPQPVWMHESGWATLRKLEATGDPQSQPDPTAEARHRVLLYWNLSYPRDGNLRWAHSEIPPPDKEGWITVFDGTDLHAAFLGGLQQRTDRFGVIDGYLWLSNRDLHFRIKERNISVRAIVHKGSAETFSLRTRNSEKGTYVAYYGSDQSVGIRRLQPPGKPTDLAQARSSQNGAEFFEMEFTVQDRNLTLKENGQTLASIEDATHDEPGNVGIAALNGRSHFKKIQVKILDAAP